MARSHIDWGKTYTITQVHDQVRDLYASSLDLCVEPFCEGLLLDGDPALLLSKRHFGQEILMRRLGSGEGSLWICGLELPGAGAPLAAKRVWTASGSGTAVEDGRCGSGQVIFVAVGC